MKIVEKDGYLEVVIDNGSVYLVDLEYKMLFEMFYWFSGHYGYLTTKNCGRTLRFHRLISNCPEGLVVDHINRNVRDNRKKNLRNVTISQNARNQANTTGRYKGVSWSKHAKKWRATVNYENKCKHLGYFKEEIDAAKAYDNFIMEYLDGDGYMNLR